MLKSFWASFIYNRDFSMRNHSFGNFATHLRLGVTPMLFRGVIRENEDKRRELLNTFVRLLQFDRYDSVSAERFRYESSLKCWANGILNIQLKVYFRENSIRYAFFVKTVYCENFGLSRYEGNIYRVGTCFSDYFPLFEHTRTNLNSVAVREWANYPSSGRAVYSFTPLNFQQLMDHFRRNYIDDFISPREQQERLERARRHGENAQGLQLIQAKYNLINLRNLNKLRNFKNKLISYPLFKYLNKNKNK